MFLVNQEVLRVRSCLAWLHANITNQDFWSWQVKMVWCQVFHMDPVPRKATCWRKSYLNQVEYLLILILCARYCRTLNISQESWCDFPEFGPLCQDAKSQIFPLCLDYIRHRLFLPKFVQIAHQASKIIKIIQITKSSFKKSLRAVGNSLQDSGKPSG
jgi:hypothetical protein